MKTHWTNRSLEDYIFSIAADFIVQLENKMEDLHISQDGLAKKLGKSKGRISQMFNNPRNPTLGKIVEYSKALNMKVAIVAYEDDDPDNKKGPISSEIFRICWEKANKPKDFWDLQKISDEVQQDLGLTTVDLEFLEVPEHKAVDRVISLEKVQARSRKAATPNISLPITGVIDHYRVVNY